MVAVDCAFGLGRNTRRPPACEGLAKAAMWLMLLAISPAVLQGQSDQGAGWRVGPEPELVIGDGEHFMHWLAQVIRRDDGALLVADGGLLNVRSFSREGDLLWTTGRDGEGPGEFRAISGMWLGSDTEIGIWDGELRRVTYLSMDGTVQQTWRVETSAQMTLRGNLEVFLGAFGDGEVLLGSLLFGDTATAIPGEPLPDRWRIGRFGADGAFQELVMTLKGMRRLPQPIPFSPLPYASVFGDTIFTVDDEGNEIQVRDRAGRVQRTVSLDVEPDVGSDPVRELRRELERRGSELYLQLLRRMGGAAFGGSVPCIGGLLVDSEGFLWVKTFAAPEDSIWLRSRALRPAGGGRWSIHAPDGTTVAVVSLPGQFTPMHVSRDAITGVTVDDFGVERVAVYRIYGR